jgi:outer membrane protein OmpA-like peptidoglycan-associated protein
VPVRRILSSALFAASALVPAWSHAQQAPSAGDEVFYYHRPEDRMAFDLQLFEPSPSPNSITTVDTASIPGHLSLTLGLWTSYAHRPWVVEDFVNGVAQPNTVRPIVSALEQSELTGSLGLFNYFEVGFAVPLVYTSHVGLATNGGLTSLDLSPTAEQHGDVRVGDIRTFVKVPILRGAWQLAARVNVTIPVNGSDAFAGNIAYTWTPALILSRAFGPLTAAVNAGYRFRLRNGLSGADAFVLDDEFIWSAGLRWDIVRRVAVNAEIFGRVGVTDGAPAANRNPIELILGGTFNATDSLSIQVGAGRGLTAGYGTPEFRVYGGLRYTITHAACTTGPEDYDGFQDGDYCADPDNDGDRIPDTEDRCPNDAEDRDGFLDDDGCAEPDNDADGALDVDDRCPSIPEDHDGYEDSDGCPEGDNDRDGVPDGTDECPMEPEDPDNYQDDDGCPEPGPEAVVVTRTESHLLLSQRVFFDYDSDTIRSVSLPILNEVARTLRANPDITRVRIEGYTDAHGDAQYNLDLSYRRARAVVEYLITQGVARDHLEYQGYGSTHPVADDRTPEGQALNRRVEFTILEQAGQARRQESSAAPTNAGGQSGTTSGRHRHRRAQ